MLGGRERHVRTDEDVVSDRDRPVVDEDEVEVRVEVASYARVDPPGRVEWGLDVGLVSAFREDSAQKVGSFLLFKRTRLVELVDRLHEYLLLFNKMWCGAVVQLARFHDFFSFPVRLEWEIVK